MCDRRGGGSVIGAFLLGGIVGAVLGLLFSPRSGKENRELISETASKYFDEGKELYETGRARVSEVYETGRETATEKAEELKLKIDSARERLKEQVGHAGEAAREKVAAVVPVAREKVHQASDAVRAGVDKAAAKADEALETVEEKTAKPGEGAS